MAGTNILIVGCGWVGTYCAGRFGQELGARVSVTTTTPEKQEAFERAGMPAWLVDFGQEGSGILPEGLAARLFDTVIVSVPITRKDDMEAIRQRFGHLATFMSQLRFKQAFFFGSVGIYPNESAVIHEDTYPDGRLDPKLLFGERAMRGAFPGINVLRLGGLFGQERVMAKYFQNKPCTIGYQTANFIHVEDIYGIIRRMMESGASGAAYSVVCPEHPLKMDVIRASAAKYGFDLPSGFDDADRTAKRVSPARLVEELGYRFVYESPLAF